MNVEFINPFLDSIVNVLTTMAQTNPKPQKAYIKNGSSAMGEVTGLIEMSSDKAKGSLAVTFSAPAILHIASQMLGEEVKEMDDTIPDTVGEITNMVTGGAKRILSEKGFAFNMALPNMFVGEKHLVTHLIAGPVLVIPFAIEAGDFFIEVCFEH